MPLFLGRMGQRTTVVAIKSVATNPEAWSEEKFLPGDVIEHLRLENQYVPLASSPFSGGKSGLLKELRKLSNKMEKIYVKIVRQAQRLEISACVVTEDTVLRKHYALADFIDKSHIVSLIDASEEDIFLMQDESRKLLEERVRAKLIEVQLKDSVIPYAWEQKMQTFLPPPNSAIVFSLLVMPFQPSRAGIDFNDVDDTAARAMAWLSASQKVGVPIIFVNIQTEPILRQASANKGFGMVSVEDASTLPSSSNYTVHDEPGVEIGILRGVRLWYAPAASELAFNLIPDENERLGVSISHTEEGFIYVSSVEHGTAAERARLKQLHEAARLARKLLVISRVAGQKVTPQMVQSSGGIRCFDTLLISQVLSQHKQALQPIRIYVMLWTPSMHATSQVANPSTASASASASPSAGITCSFSRSTPSSPVVRMEHQSNKQLQISQMVEYQQIQQGHGNNRRLSLDREPPQNNDFSFSF